MKFFIDTANLSEIREAAGWGVLAGVTTNPSLIVKEGGDMIATLVEIAELVDGPVSAEVVADTAAEMVRQGLLLDQLHRNIIIKVPLTEAGISACAQLSAQGIRVNVTLCFQAAQALLAARAGASYISPFIGRLDDISTEGMDLIADIAEIYGQHPDIETQILAASIRHPLHVVQAARAGADVATVPFKVLKKIFTHPLTDAGNARFEQDWQGAGDLDIAAAAQAWLDARKN